MPILIVNSDVHLEIGSGLTRLECCHLETRNVTGGEPTRPVLDEDEES